MAQRQNIIEESFENVQARFRSAGEELQKLQDRANENRQELADRAQARAEKVQKQLLKVPAIKAADDFRIDMVKQIEAQVDEFISRMPVASMSEVKKLERKVNGLTRKVRALEKAAQS
jgi:hypothetical protein